MWTALDMAETPYSWQFLLNFITFLSVIDKLEAFQWLKTDDRNTL